MAVFLSVVEANEPSKPDVFVLEHRYTDAVLSRQVRPLDATMVGALMKVNDSNQDLEMLAQAAFDLGREYQRRKNRGKK